MIVIIDVDLPIEDESPPKGKDGKAVRKNSIKQSQQIDDDVLYQVASKLMDEGYGSFDRCLAVAKACKGDIFEAEQVLSKLIFKEFKKEDDEDDEA